MAERNHLWTYTPSLAAGVVFVILFTACTALAIWRTITRRCSHCIPFILGGIFEIVGYCGHILGSATDDNNDDKDNIPYILQYTCILLAPALFAATIYMTLGRLMKSLKGQRHSLVPARWLPLAFVCGDIVSLATQAAGAAITMIIAEQDSSASGQFESSSGRNGRIITVVGRILQILLLGAFIAVATKFQIGMQHWPSGPSLNPKSQWRRTVKLLCIASAAIVARSLFRAVETGCGARGYLLSHEWTLYAFDAVPMLAVMAMYTLWFPGVEGEEAEWWAPMEGQDDDTWETTLPSRGTGGSSYRV